MVEEKIYERYCLNNKASLVHSGRQYFAALTELIRSAETELHLQVYIFEPDQTGIAIKDELIRAAGRNVKIYLLLDGFGSSSLSDKFIRELTDAGIFFRWFGPLFSKMRIHLGRRMHYKVAVADASRALVGGINIGDRYNEIDGQPPWLDFAIYTEGEIAFQLAAFCHKKWRGMKLPRIRKVKPQPAHFRPYDNDCPIRIRVNDRLRRRARIVYSYRDAIRKSKNDIIIAGAYFMPGRTFIRLMNRASLRGVSIRLITGMQSDVWLAQYGLRYLYRRLLRNNILIYEYTRAPVHGKTMVVDQEFVTLGSYDLNQLSAFINLELNLDIREASFARQLHGFLENTIEKDCILITPELLKKREGPLTMLRQWMAYRLLRILFFITLFVSNKNGT